MTDNLPPIAANASHIANLSTESIAAAKQSYLAAGYTSEQIDSALGTQTGNPIVATPRSTTLMAAAGADGITQQQKEAGSHRIA